MSFAPIPPFEVANFQDRRAMFQTALWQSAQQLNIRYLSSPTIVHSKPILIELAGGASPISSYVSPDWLHIVVDKEIDGFSVGYHHNVCADVHLLPIKDSSANLIITISSLQYFEQDQFFAECRRVLNDGGILAVHENGAWNPFLLLGRLGHRILGIFRWNQWRYRNTIKR